MNKNSPFIKIAFSRKVLSIIGTCFILAGCATTEYTQREGSFWGSGYYDKKIQEGVYKVGYTGNASTLGDVAEDLALLRAADVTLQSGYNYFLIVDKAKRTNVNSSHTPLMPYTYKGNTYYTGGYSTNTYTPDIEMTVRCYVKKPLDTKEVVFDAKEIKTNLGDKYMKKKGETKKTAASADKKSAAESKTTASTNSTTSAPRAEQSAMSPEDKAAAENAFDAALKKP